MFKDEFNMKCTCWDPLGIFCVIMFADSFSEVRKPLKDVLGCDVCVLENCHEDLVADFGLFNVVEA